MENIIEVWKDVPGYEGMYQVSDLGRVKSLSRIVNSHHKSYTRKERILKLHKDTHGYMSIVLQNKPNISRIKIHQLVAIAFLDYTRDKQKTVIDHIDNDKENNKLSNLQILTNRENVSKSVLIKNKFSKFIGVTKSGEKYRSQIIFNKKRYHLGNYINEIDAANAYENAINKIKNNDLSFSKKNINV